MSGDIYFVVQIYRNNEWVKVSNHNISDWRNYETFAVLSDVHNGIGFTGECWKVLYEPRGLPLDLIIDDNMEILNYNRDRVTLLGEHSHSWLSLSELKEIGEYYKNKKLKCVEIDENSDNNEKINYDVDGKNRLGLLYYLMGKLSELSDTLVVCDDDIRIIFGFNN